jgi:hypothetical protein
MCVSDLSTNLMLWLLLPLFFIFMSILRIGAVFRMLLWEIGADCSKMGLVCWL